MKRKFRNRFYTVSLATTILATSAFLTTPVSASTSFTDVTTTNTHYQAIMKLSEAGIIKGYTDGTFKPSEAVTRGQAVKMLAGILNLDTNNVKNPNFKDVSTSSEYYGAIAALANLKIITGFEDGTFKPSQPITRGQMAKIVSIGFDLDERPSTNTPFTDIKNSSYKSYVEDLYSAGVTKGTTATSFAPTKYLTRGQLASLLVRADELDTNFDLSIMYTNDTHGRVDMAPKRASAVKDVRSKKPDALLLDAGDVFSGTLYSNEFQGQADLAFMNYMGYDAMTFGNHEFDLGISQQGHQALADFIKGADFPLVSANIDFSKDSKFNGLFTDLVSSDPKNGKIYAGITKVINGEKVGIFGLTTEETKDIAFVGSVQFENYIKEAQKAVDAFKNSGVTKIIALTHLGYDDNPKKDNDLLLATNVDGIDVIVGGHSHTKLDKPVIIEPSAKKKEPTIIVQAYQYSDFLGTLDVQFNGAGIVTSYNGELLKIADYAADPVAEKMLKPFKDKVSAISNKEIGATATAPLLNPRLTDEGNKGVSVRSNETALGNLVTDGMLKKAKQFTKKEVVMALQNGGGIRAGIDSGSITAGEVITVLPFGNTLALMDVTGAELKAAFETSFANYPKENGGFLHISGAQVKFDSTKEAGKRVVSIKYKDASGNYITLENNKTYTIATNAFTAKGGDGFTMFAKAYEEGRVTDLGLSDWENFAEYLTSLKTVTPKVENRIEDLLGKDGSSTGGSSGGGGGTTSPPQNVTITVDKLADLEGKTITGNLTITGNVKGNAVLQNVKINGNLDLSGVNGDIQLVKVVVNGDTIL
ncbi:MAG: S-layer homology domain-containing protein [Lysinibacillus sp.]